MSKMTAENQTKFERVKQVSERGKTVNKYLQKFR